MSYEMVEDRLENRCKQSPLYMLQTVYQLVALFGISVAQLWDLAKHPERYYRVYEIMQNNGRLRIIEAPQGIMKSIQKKIQLILKQEEFPKYLSSPATGRTPLSNVEAHRRRLTTIDVDIERFYPSCRESAVYHFFRYTVCCSKQVSWILTQIVCFQGHLPTGAPSSPLVAFYTYEELFTLLYGIAPYYRFSLWVDNITFSCMRIQYEDDNKEFIEQVQTYLNIWGFRLNRSKSRIYQANKSTYITGYHIAPNGDISVRNAIHHRLYEARQQRKCAVGEDRVLLTQKIKSYEKLIADAEKSNKRYKRKLARQAQQER